MRVLLGTLSALTLATAACSRSSSDISKPAGSTASAHSETPALGPDSSLDRSRASRFAGAPRVVAIGDVHGDLTATRNALKLVGAIDDQDRWIGRDLVVVQTGDQLDRGQEERKILDLFDRLTDEASKAGGAFHALNGNHETMNVALDFRYVTAYGFADFKGISSAKPSPGSVADFARDRATAFQPGGPYALMLAKRNVSEIIGDTVFVHGGILPKYAEIGLDKINQEIKSWMRGESLSGPPESATADDSPLWSRAYSAGKADCGALERSLLLLRAKRMVVGHTVQKQGITSACDGRVWRIDVGLAAVYGGKPQALEIRGDQVRILGAG